jgi:hypothetical protein
MVCRLLREISFEKFLRLKSAAQSSVDLAEFKSRKKS